MTLGVAGVVLPSAYLYLAAGLPQVESEYELETHLRLAIEGERTSIRAGRYEEDARSHRFERPEFAKLPHDFIALYISQMGCSTFFRTPREEGGKWALRMVGGLVGSHPSGDGWCERWLSLRLASAIGVRGNVEQTIAGNKLRGFLQKDQLVAYDLATIHFDRGVVGVEDAAWEIYRKRVDQMDLAELAEFTLALPVHGYYRELKTCKNPVMIKHNRDVILNRLVDDALVSQAKVKAALTAPIACVKSR